MRQTAPRRLEIVGPLMEAVMIDHTGLNVSDPLASRAFYDRALAPLGYKIPKEHTGGAAVFSYGVPPKPDFWVNEGIPNTPRIHIAFRAETREQVDEFYQAAIAAGGKDNGSPGPRPHYHKDHYGAFVLDPDGHNVEAVCHGRK
jgi:catechol 2,3-dioxygenase-like lactoylglutathione lyase family enzyme